MEKRVIAIVCIALLILARALESAKIVGLVQVRNEAPIIEQCLRCLAVYTDAIIVLDDASEDNTVTIVRSLASELHIERIICEATSGWVNRTEIENRQKLLDTGRAIGGTHFIELDADEVLSAACAHNNWLRAKMLSLRKGQILHLPIINLWKSFDYYRDGKTGEFPDIVQCSAIFCDDGTSTLEGNRAVSHSGFLHFGRFPIQRKKKSADLHCTDIRYAILHLPFVQWENTYIKRGWIMCLEYIRLKEHLSLVFPYRTVHDINTFYQTFHNYADTHVILKPALDIWFAYPFFDKACYTTRQVMWRKQQVHAWFAQYGRDYFKDLDIWYINWDA